MLVSESAMDDGKLLDPSSSRALVEYKQLIAEMRSQNFDVIRFATYRTACKLKFIQRKTNLHLVDLWNVIESFRETGLNGVDLSAEMNVSRLETAISSIYRQLNKRLPAPQQIDAEASIALLLNWLLSVYDGQERGKIRVYSVKVALALMCSGKLMDKLRYVFSQVADANTGLLVMSKFDHFLRECLALPTAMYEGPSFGYSTQLAKGIFAPKDGASPRVSVNDFLDTLLADPGPQCLLWLPILHRMALVENVFHPVKCEACLQESFLGFRYKCQRCYNYHLCQDCFWRGRTSGNHTNNHEMKEYCSYKNPGKALSHSLRKSFRSAPVNKPVIPRFPATPEKTLDMTHIVPPVSTSPISMGGVRNGVGGIHTVQSDPYERVNSINTANHNRDSRDGPPLAGKFGHGAGRTSAFLHGGGAGGGVNRREQMSSGGGAGGFEGGGYGRRGIDPLASRVDEEHHLIARYAARLANTTMLSDASVKTHQHDLSGSGDGSGDSHRSPSGAASDDASSSISGGSIFNLSDNTTRAQRELICQLEAKNRQIMSEIQRLRIEQEATKNVSLLDAVSGTGSAGALGSGKNPALIAELRLLRQRKDELEGRMTTLQESRHELVVQLEGLMKLLKNQTASPKSSQSGGGGSQGRYRTGPNAAQGPAQNLAATTSPQGQNEASLTGLGGDVRQAFGESNAKPAAAAASGPSELSLPITTLRNDLLVAADSVTSAMSTLVKELNSEGLTRGGESEKPANQLDIAMLAEENMILSRQQRMTDVETPETAEASIESDRDLTPPRRPNACDDRDDGSRLCDQRTMPRSMESGTSPCGEFGEEFDLVDSCTSPFEHLEGIN